MRWAARIISIILVGIFILFFIGEGNIDEFAKLTGIEILLMIFVPIVFTAGVVIAWRKEMLGGIVILASVLGYNLVDRINSSGFKWEIEFAFLLVPGILFILTSRMAKRQNRW